MAEIISGTTHAMEALVALLDSSEGVLVQEQAARALGAIAAGSPLDARLASTGQAVMTLVEALHPNRRDIVHQAAAQALASIAAGSDVLRQHVGTTPGILPALTQLLAVHNKVWVRVAAAIALAEISVGGEQLGESVACGAGTLDGLEAMLHIHYIGYQAGWRRAAAGAMVAIAASGAAMKVLQSFLLLPQHQRYTAGMLGSIARAARIVDASAGTGSPDKPTVLRALGNISTPDIVAALVAMLWGQGAAEAAHALANIAEAGKHGAERVAAVPGATDALLGSVRSNASAEVQQHALRALAAVADGGAGYAVRVAGMAGMAGALVDLLGPGRPEGVQREAARAVEHIAGSTVPAVVTSMPGVLEALVRHVGQVDVAGYACSAEAMLSALATIVAAGSSDLKQRVASLLFANNMRVAVCDRLRCVGPYKGEQEQAARLLAELAKGGPALAQQVASAPCGLDNIVWLLDCNKPYRAWGALLLAELAKQGLSETVASREGALWRLVDLLGSQWSQVAAHAARALAAIAEGSDTLKERIAGEPAALRGLTHLLGAEEPAGDGDDERCYLRWLVGRPEYQASRREQAAAALAAIACGSQACKERVAGTAGTLSKLAGLLGGDVPERVQQQARRALQAIATGGASLQQQVAAVAPAVVAAPAGNALTAQGAPAPPAAGCRMFSAAQLRQATGNFHASSLIGSGGFGKVYKGMLDGTAVAIKVGAPALLG